MPSRDKTSHSFSPKGDILHIQKLYLLIASLVLTQMRHTTLTHYINLSLFCDYILYISLRFTGNAFWRVLNQHLGPLRKKLYVARCNKIKEVYEK